MSINHFSPDLPDTLWWTQHPHHIMDPNNTNINTSSNSKQQHQQHQHREAANSWSSHHHHHNHHQQQQQQLYHSQVWLNSQQSASMLIRSPNPSHTFNLNVGDEAEVLDAAAADEDDNRSAVEAVVEKEAMFEKPLTPSDVGKLNRLVIPKQHAEKYFPLGGDSSDKGLLLSFEDESGKCWRFRYSYWNSSQSYVLTKGWSRYVKEKQLDAGDVVLFERHRTDADRFFIGWRRRSAPPQETVAQNSNSVAAAAAGGEQWTRVYYSAHPYPTHPGHGHGPQVPYQPDCIHAGNGSIVPTTVPAGNLKRLRLFGVNLECQLDESEPSTPDGSSSVSSQGATHYNHHHYYSPQPYSSNHMDRSFCGDVNQQQQMRNERG